jgi:hypothetical protein
METTMTKSIEAVHKTSFKAAPQRAAAAFNKKIGPSVLSGKPASKVAMIVSMLRRPKGACINDLMKATGWQAHSVRGAISGSLRKKLGLQVTSQGAGSARLYLISNKRAV